MKYPQTSAIAYPDHTKFKLPSSFAHELKLTQEGVKLIEWLEENIGERLCHDFGFPMFARGWEIQECGSLDHNPGDYDWRNINLYKIQGELGYFLIIHDVHEQKIVELKLTGLIEATFS